MAEETVLTSRRALLLAGRRWSPGRLRISDRVIRFTAHDGAITEIAVSEVSAIRVVRRPRPALQLETPGGAVRLRCFAATAVATLLR